MIFNLAYGKTGHTVELPDNLKVDLIEPRWIESIQDQDLAITAALRNPYGCKPLKDTVKYNDKVAIIFSDITRATPYDIIIPALMTELQNIPQKNICFFCANGTHRLSTAEELNMILGKDIVRDYRIVQNDANNPDLFEYMGTTTSGNKVLMNKEFQNYEVKILTGFIEPHFFAGYSGGGKALVPGMAYVETIKFNHSIASLSLENVNWGITYGNPLWEEITEAAEFSSGLFLLNITLNRDKKITNVFAGDLRTAHQAGCEFVRDSAMVPVDSLYDIVITSNSGYPLDLNIYQTVKGMSAAAQIVKEGGNIIIASECWDGLPANSDYETILNSVKSVDELMDFIKTNESELKDTWQIFYQALIQKKANVYMFTDKIDNETVRRAFLNPVEDIARLTKELVRKIGPDTNICIMPEGPQTIPYLSVSRQLVP
jgi:nickel-dependent lactate racemase